MGCGSSRESRPSDPSDVPPTATTRTTVPIGVTSQTAINHPLSTTTSRQQSRIAHDSSASHFSTPRASTISRPQPHSHHAISLAGHVNTPLVPPAPWTSTQRTWSPVQLARERSDFFETRVTGRPEIWSALKEVTELIRAHDLVEAQGILDAAGITLPTGHLEAGAYDERGQSYRLPEHIITDPQNLLSEDNDGKTMVGEDTEAAALSKKLDLLSSSDSLPLGAGDPSAEKNKDKDAIPQDAVKIKCRLSDRGGPDTVVLLGKEQPVSVLLRRLRSEAVLSSSATVRIVYFGKILKEDATLEEQGWREGHVVQALVSEFGVS